MPVAGGASDPASSAIGAPINRYGRPRPPTSRHGSVALSDHLARIDDRNVVGDSDRSGQLVEGFRDATMVILGVAAEFVGLCCVDGSGGSGESAV